MFNLFLYCLVFYFVLKNNISFLKKYSLLRKGIKQKGVVLKLNRREKYFSTTVKVPVFKYAYLGKEYQGEPIYSQWLFFIKKNIGNEVNLFIDKQNPNSFVMAIKEEVYICLFTTILLLGGGLILFFSIVST